MKRAREEDGPGYPATKNGACGGSEGGEELRNKLANLREDTSASLQMRSGLTDSNSNQMLVEEGDNLGFEEKQAMANKELSPGVQVIVR